MILLAVFAIDLPWRFLRVATAILAAIYGVVATLSTKLSYSFVVNYGVSAIDRSEEGANAYLSMWLLSLLEFILFLALLVLLLLLLRCLRV